ncbi:retrovirus-related pol polyprotein from transposon TNT 1-94, partial [Tanacetum coccineum]
MTGDRSRLMNFVKKFIGTVRFGNDHFGAIMGYGDYVVGDSVISRVYYVDGLGHNLFSVSQFCDSDLEVAFRKHLHDEVLPNLLAIQSLQAQIMVMASAFKPLELRKKYILVIVDDYSQFTWVKFLRSKDETPTVVIKFLKQIQVFGALCYPTNDSENLGKLQPRADIGIFIRYLPSRKGYRFYNKQTRQIMETIHVQFDELTEQMAPVQSSPGPAPNLLTPGPISSGLVPNPAPSIPYVPPTNKEMEMLFQPMFDEYFNPPVIRQDHIPNVVQDPVITPGPSVSISIDLDAPSGSHISSPLDHHSSLVYHGLVGEQYVEVNPFAAADPEPFVNVFALNPTSEASSSGEIIMPEPNQSTQPHKHIRKWTDSHPLDNIIGNPSRPVSTRKQLAMDALWCFYNSVLSKVEPKN